ncbi:hypothetical protein OSB04_010584 [Centaurea solstitialis]|uniref:Uncharacterized protein n=1 Tax=Centaurea solstitialis TaxID=347529 RepID=A0AA38TJL6_9ASTR|nr:hypothetical protein OSB04_010584 [Centaurea solstitialis]
MNSVISNTPSLTVPSGRYDTWTFLHYITHDQVRLPVKLVSLFIYNNYRIKRIFRYLKGTPNLGLWYPRDSGFDLTAC